MTGIVPLGPRLPKNPEVFPIQSAEEATETVARNLVALFDVIRQSQITGRICPASIILQAEQVLAAVSPNERGRLEDACRPATREYLGEHVGAMLAANPQGANLNGGAAYGAIMVTDIGNLEPSKGAVETGCRRVRTTARWLPNIPDVIAAVREAGQLYEWARRAHDELPALVVKAKRDPVARTGPAVAASAENARSRA